jgi:alkylation response protein AidB-like acyl-CoA dehydrogenase
LIEREALSFTEGDLINISERHSMIRDTAHSFCEREIRPVADALDEAEVFPEKLYSRMAEIGLFGVSLPDSDGGVGADMLAYAIVMEEIGRGYASLADELGNVEMVGTLLSRYGTPEQKSRYLDPLLKGTYVSAFAITEANAGSDVAGIRTMATRAANGWELNGEKIWIHNAPNFDFAVVLARTDKDKGHRGMSTFLVDRNLPGVSSGRKERKMGQRASQVGPISFDNVHLPDDALLGPENRGFHQMMSVLEKGRIGIAGMAVGIIRAALDASIEQAKMRHQFSEPIANFQAIQILLADMAKDLHAARLLTYAAAEKLEKEGRAGLEVSIAKCFASDAAVARSSDAIQIFGGSGYIRGFEVERLYRDAKITQIYEGTNQIQRMIIARQLIAD